MNGVDEESVEGEEVVAVVVVLGVVVAAVVSLVDEVVVFEFDVILEEESVAVEVASLVTILLFVLVDGEVVVPSF